MPPQWNPYEEIPEAPLPPLVAERGPLDEILADVPAAPVAAPRAIPSDQVSMVPELPAPPPVVGARPQPVEASPMSDIPAPPMRATKPQPVDDMFEIPRPPKPAPDDLAPDFSRVDLAKALDVVSAPPSVDVTGSTQRAQTAERNLETFTQALGDAQRDAVSEAQREQGLTRQAADLDQQIAGLKAIKKPTAEQKAELTALTNQRTALDGEIKAAGTAVQDALGRFTTAREQQAVARQDADQARDQAQTDMATLELESERRGAAAQEAGAVLFAKESKRIEDDARAQTAKITAEEGAARARMDEDRKVYREALKAGPAKTSMVLTVASVIAEALAARHTRREPDFSRVIAGLEKATKAEFDDRVQRQLSLIAESEDTLAKAAQQKRVIDAQKASRLSEMLRSIEIEIEGKKAAARGTAKEAGLAMVQGDVRKARENADVVAMEALKKAQAADEKARLDRELQEAQIRKAQAEASEKEAEAARKAGMGTGEGKSEAWSSRDPNKVYMPFTDTVLAVFDGANADKRAEKAGALVTDGFKYMKLLREYEADVEDYGSRKLMDRSTWTESAEYRKLATKHARLRTALAKVIAGQGFSTTESDNRSAEKMAPLPTTWNDNTKAALEQMIKDGEDDFRLTLNQAVDTRAQETLIREARRLGTSETDMQRALVAKAPALLVDADKPVEARLQALATLNENLKTHGTAEGPDDVDRTLLDELRVLDNAITSIEKQEYDPEDPESGVTDEAAAVIAGIVKRKREIQKMRREIAKTAIESTEGKAARDKEGARRGEFYGRAKL